MNDSIVQVFQWHRENTFNIYTYIYIYNIDRDISSDHHHATRAHSLWLPLNLTDSDTRGIEKLSGTECFKACLPWETASSPLLSERVYTKREVLISYSFPRSSFDLILLIPALASLWRVNTFFMLPRFFNFTSLSRLFYTHIFLSPFLCSFSE